MKAFVVAVAIVFVLAGCATQDKAVKKPTKTIVIVGPVIPVNTNSPFYKK